ncbi:MAG TPA: acyltransferase family protein [Nocardioides sp.]
MAATAAEEIEKTQIARQGKIRRDIEGLRAVATFLVLPYHAGLMLFPGGFVGVDVFFVISGFVITAGLIAEVRRTGSIGLIGFYARRAKRLLPASAVVLIGTAVAVWLWVPKIRWETIGGDIFASSLYFVNWRLAERSVDYLAEDVTPSPVQHYWSLSVEEQYYFIWPIVLLLAVLIATKLGVRARVGMLVGLLLVALPSFGWALHQATANPEFAYFDTFTRMFEFAVGALVAIVATRLDRMPQWLGASMAWVGLVMILLAGRFFTAEITWPSYNALLPTVGAGMLIAGGVAAGRAGPIRILGNRMMMFFGALTYSLYLWHWPMLIVAREHRGSISVTTGLIIVVLSIVPAWLTYHLVENPIRYSTFVKKNLRAAGLIGLTVTMAGVIAGLLLIVSFHQATSGAAEVKGAAVLGNVSATPKDDPSASPSATPAPDAPVPGAPVDVVDGPISPDPLLATEDVPDLYAEDCQVLQDQTEVRTCTYGPDDAETTIAIVGDSKAGQWTPAFQVLAETHDWQVKTYTMSACTFSSRKISLDGEPYDNCHTWGKDVIDRLTGDEKPDVVFTSNFRGSAFNDEQKATPEAGVDGLIDYWKRLADAGVKVVAMGDNPYPAGVGKVYECVAENPKKLTKCSFDRQRGIEMSGISSQLAAAKEVGATDISPGRTVTDPTGPYYVIDMTKQICPTERCAAVIGNALVYRQGSHITKTYVETLAPFFEKSLAKAGIE